MKKFLSIIFFSFLSILPIYTHAQSVDILWQGEGYVHPFYDGKNLWGKQSEITFMAIPQGLGSPASLKYVWSKNGTVLGLISGVGKNSMSLVDTIFSKPVKIKVEVVNSQDRVLAENSLTLNSSIPLLAVYENHPLYGFMFNEEIFGSHQMKRDEVVFTAFPLFFSSSRLNSSSVAYNWKLNGQSGERKSNITLRTPESGAGYTDVSVVAAQASIPGQKAERSFLVQFGNNAE